MRRLIAALERIATALEQLVPALTQATREHRYTTVTGGDEADGTVSYPSQEPE